MPTILIADEELHLILHRVADHIVRLEQARYMAERIAGPKLFELPGEHHLFCTGNADTVTDGVDEFLTGVRRTADTDRVLATVLFVDVVGSTEVALRLGDRRWRNLLEWYYSMLRRELGRFSGHETDTAGDGLLAAFDGPA